MKSTPPLVLCINVAAATSVSEIGSRTPIPHRRAQDKAVNSNDKIDYLSFNRYSCDGIFLDWTPGPSILTTTFSARVVEYDYDAFIEFGSDMTTTLTDIQNSLLRYVGEVVLGDCRRRLGEGLVIEEINTAPGDQPSLSTPCAIEKDTPNQECIAVHGAMTVYYSSSGDKASDEANIDNTVRAAVKSGMDAKNEALWYIGDRDDFSFTKSLFVLNNGEPTFWDKGGTKIAIGLSSVGLVLFLLIICCKMRRQSKNDDLSSIDNDIEIGTEIATQRSIKSEKSKKSTKNEKEVETDLDDSASHKYGMTCCWK